MTSMLLVTLQSPGHRSDWPGERPHSSKKKLEWGTRRTDTNGNASSSTLGSWDLYFAPGCSGPVAAIRAAHLITNADQGVLVSWQVETGPSRLGAPGNATTNHIAIVNGGSVVSQATTPSLLKPVLQAQDGSFFGTSQNNEGIVSFESSGRERWSVPGDSPKVATADGGVIGTSGVTYDSRGKATGMSTSLPKYSWSGERYALMGNSVTDLALPPIPFATSYATMTGGSPSENGTAIGVNTANEFRIPVFVLASTWGTTCWLGNGRVPLAGDALEHYMQKKQALLSGDYLTSPSCSAFFHETPQRAAYFDRLTDAVTRQVPYDGRESLLSQYDAGMWTSWAFDVDISTKKKLPVCALFRAWKSEHGKRPGERSHAAAQLQPPGTDVYVNAEALDDITQGTVLHEALHNLTGLYDSKIEGDTHDELEELLGLKPKVDCTDGSICITRKLVEVGCAGTD